MSNIQDKEHLHSALFMNLVMTFQAAAWQQMGKIKDPMTDKIERDLEQARMSIDMLDMLHTKTVNNLKDEEAKFLSHIISELKLNYVDELNKDKKAGEKKEAEPTPEDKTKEEPMETEVKSEEKKEGE